MTATIDYRIEIPEMSHSSGFGERMTRWQAVFALSAAAIAAAFLECPLWAAEVDLKPFPVDWASSPESPVSVAFLLEPPAGKDGFIRIANGHLVRPDGTRFRIWGVNVTGRAGLPSTAHAPTIAAHLARCGVNAVRFHFLDRPAPDGLIDAGRNDTRALAPAQLDRLDYFVAQLKARGIYTDLNLNVVRCYKAGDGVRDYELVGWAKGLTYFDRRLIELQKEYARQLFTHRNPYTGSQYCTEPAVVLVEIVNENTLLQSWLENRLLGQQTRKVQAEQWVDIPASYEQDLTNLYNRWLPEHVSGEVLGRLRTAAGISAGAQIPRLRPAEFAAASKERFQAEAAFYMDLERRFYEEMARYLREELGVKALLIGTADHNARKSGYPLLTSTSRLDVVDGHTYWQHPRCFLDPETGRRVGFEIPNTPMVNDPAHCVVVRLSRTAMAGKPYTVTEMNHPFPNEYACEGIPLLSAYAAFHDWDGVFWYTLGHHRLIDETPPGIRNFDLAHDPVKMSQLAAGALTFLRGDVRPASRTIERSYSTEQVCESLRLPRSEAVYFTPGFAQSLSLVHATRIASLAGPPTGRFESPPGAPLLSDTGELCWTGAEAKQGIVTVQTERTQGLIGFCKANGRETKNLATTIENPFCAITLSALEAKPISRSGRLLITATARVANAGMQWNTKRTTLAKHGTLPACIEPVKGTLILKGMEGATAVSVQPLDGTGHPLGKPLSAQKADTGWRFPIGDPPTTWYLVSVSR